MKTFLTASIIINLLLAILVLRLLHPGHGTEKTSPATATATILTRLQDQNPSSPPPENPAPGRTFRWRQLESTNYHTYIANLRGIGCPEQTIRDLITADVDEAFYVPRRAVVKQQQTGQALEDTLGAMAQQETALVTTLLGGEVVASVTSASSSSPGSNLRFIFATKPALETPVAAPLILQPADLSAMKLSDAQIQTIGELRRAFIREVGTNQDPNDPAYLQRWQTAQREADNMLVGMLGRNFVLRYQTELENHGAGPK